MKARARKSAPGRIDLRTREARGTASHTSSGRTGRLASLVAVALTLIAFFALAPSADALTQRPFKEIFGSAAKPTIEATTIAVELRSGDVLVATEEGGGSIRRFHANGTPAAFAKLGTNVLDGREDNGKPCSEEPASCDETPTGELGVMYRSQIAIDESGGVADGDIYLSVARTVYIFAADGTYLGELPGYKEVEFATSPNEPNGVAVDRTGAVFVTTANEIYKFVPTANPVDNEDGVFGFRGPPGQITGFGAPAIGAGPTAGSLFVPANENNGFQIFKFAASTGALQSEFAGESNQRPVAVDPRSGTVLFSAEGEIQEWEAAPNSQPRRVGRIYGPATPALAIDPDSEVIASEGTRLGVYGRPITVPTVTIEPASGVTGTRAILSGTVNPSNVQLTDCYFEYGLAETGELTGKAPCEGSPRPSDSSPHRVQAEIRELEPDGHTYRFRLVATVAEGREESSLESLTTAYTVVTRPADPISTTSATLNGRLLPEGESYSACYFEYGVATNRGYERREPCTPRAEEIPPAYSARAVSAPISGLQIATTYRFRLIATTPAGTKEGEELTFTTQGAPRVTEVRALDAGQSSVTLEGKVDPSGFGTTYRFEWGPTSSYGNQAPVGYEPFLGAGELPVRVTAQITGLSAGSTYHYRLVASSVAGIVASPDHVLETLDTCGLSEGRCFELVSRSEPGPIAIPGEASAFAELHFQVAPGGNGVTYPVESGYPEAHRGADVLYRAERGTTGWQSTEIGPEVKGQSYRNETGSEVGQVQWLSDDLSCGFLQSSQPLVPSAAMEQVREYGGLNYYRQNPDGSFTAVTSLAPENPEVANGGLEYGFDGASQNCQKLFFTTEYRYPGVSVPEPEANNHLYEWDEGVLRGVAGSLGGQNAVSADGSRVFFQGGRVLENGVPREYAASQTATPAMNVQYQWANRAGSRVFFTANAGLTSESSGEGTPEGTDLYEYDLETGELTDRTVYQGQGGANVSGFLGAAEDGSVVYFASQVQLVPGSGPNQVQNERAGTYSIYAESGGAFQYAGRAADQGGLFVGEEWTSQVSPDGRYLLFQSTQDVTGYESGGSFEAYLFDHDGGQNGATTCVSCRQDGLPSVAPREYTVLTVGTVLGNHTHRPQFLIERGGSAQVFFSSADALAPGATVGQNNIYEWAHDQVFRLTSAPEKISGSALGGRYAIFAGASSDGVDAFLASPENLTAEDRDGRISIYDARVGGGFPAPPAPPAPCVPNAENSCQGPPPAAVPGTGAATTGDSGSQNFRPRKKHCHKKQKRCVKKTKKKGSKKGKGKKRPARRADNHRRAGQ